MVIILTPAGCKYSPHPPTPADSKYSPHPQLRRAVRRGGLTPANFGRDPYADRRQTGLVPGVYDFPALVITALRASLVRLFHFVTVRAFGQGWWHQKVVRAALILAGV